MESAFGRSLSHVDVRTDAQSASRAASLGANAYTDGAEIGFAEDVFAPDQPEGMHTIAHEFAHVVQSQGGTGDTNGGVGAVSLEGVQARPHEPTEDPSLIEANADAAADDVVRGRIPSVLPAKMPGVALDDPKAQHIPPRGSFIVAPLKGGGFQYTFNGEDALTWSNRAMTVFTYYMKDNFPGVTDQIIQKMAAGLSVELLNVEEKDIKKFHRMQVIFDANVETTVRKSMKKSYPQYAPSRAQTGQRTLENNDAVLGQGKQMPATKTETPPTKQDPVKPPDFTEEDKKLADELAELIKDSKQKTKVDPKELVQLYKMIKEAVKDPKFTESGQSMFRFAKFYELNKDKITGILESGEKGNLSQEKLEEIIAEYGKFIAAEPVDKDPGDQPLETVEDFDKEFKYDENWQQMSKLDRKLMLDYAKLRPDDITDEKLKSKTVSRDTKVMMALKLADKSTLGAMKDAAEKAFSDPAFVITLVLMLAIYVGLWLTPDPTFITKLAAGALTVAMLLQFAWSDIIGTVRAFGTLRDECDVSFDVKQLRDAGNKFFKKLGTVGFDILMFIVMWRVGKRVGPKVQEAGVRRTVERAQKNLTTAENQPGSGVTPKATAATANLLSQAKAAAPDPGNPTSVLDTLAGSLKTDAQKGLQQFRVGRGDANTMKALESETGRGMDLDHFLASKGMAEPAIQAAKADVAKARVAVARARLMEAETIKDPTLRQKARTEQFNALLKLLSDLGVLRNAKVQKSLTSRNLDGLISAIGEAIARKSLKANSKYAGNSSFKVHSNLAIVKEIRGFKSVAEWRAARKAQLIREGNIKEGTPESAKLEKELSRAAAKHFEQNGKLYEALGEIDMMMVETVKGGKPRPVELSEVKTGGGDKAGEAMAQLDAAQQTLMDLHAKKPDIYLFERVAHHEIGRNLSAEYDLSTIGTATKSTYGLQGKTGFSESLGVNEETIIGLAQSLVDSLPPSGTTPSLPPVSKEGEE
jgi:hypothetical protein